MSEYKFLIYLAYVNMMESYDAYCTSKCYDTRKFKFHLFRVDDIFCNNVPNCVLHSNYKIDISIKLIDFPITP